MRRRIMVGAAAATLAGIVALGTPAGAAPTRSYYYVGPFSTIEACQTAQQNDFHAIGPCLYYSGGYRYKASTVPPFAS
jgi:hypothetical protein